MDRIQGIRVVPLTSFDKFIKGTSKHPQEITIYRGVRHEKYDLRPKIGRIVPKNNGERLIDLEKRMLRRFQERAVPYLDPGPTYEFEWLARAQHHGLPTRLLDWSRNPLVAAFFAVEREILDCELIKGHSGNSAVYVFRGKTVISQGTLPRTTEEYEAGPFEVTQTEKFVPSHWDSRIVAQMGVFTVHHDPTDPYPLDHDCVRKLTIPFEQRGDWKKRLNALGVNRASLFPDLDNLSKYIEWCNTKSF